MVGRHYKLNCGALLLQGAVVMHRRCKSAEELGRRRYRDHKLILIVSPPCNVSNFACQEVAYPYFYNTRLGSSAGSLQQSPSAVDSLGNKPSLPVLSRSLKFPFKWPIYCTHRADRRATNAKRKSVACKLRAPSISCCQRNRRDAATSATASTILTKRSRWSASA